MSQLSHLQALFSLALPWEDAFVELEKESHHILSVKRNLDSFLMGNLLENRLYSDLDSRLLILFLRKYSDTDPP